VVLEKNPGLHAQSLSLHANSLEVLLWRHGVLDVPLQK